MANLKCMYPWRTFRQTIKSTPFRFLHVLRFGADDGSWYEAKSLLLIQRSDDEGE